MKIEVPYRVLKVWWYLQNVWVAIKGDHGYSVYCRDCGSCGESGCCHPNTCKHLYCDGYKRDYRDLEADIIRLEGTQSEVTDSLASVAASFIRHDADPTDIEYRYMAKLAAKYERLCGREDNAVQIETEFNLGPTLTEHMP